MLKSVFAGSIFEFSFQTETYIVRPCYGEHARISIIMYTMRDSIKRRMLIQLNAEGVG